VKRRKRGEIIAAAEDEMDVNEGVDSTTFSSDDQFISEYGFSYRVESNGGEAEGDVDGDDDGFDHDDVLVSEYGASADNGGPGSEGEVEEVDDTMSDDLGADDDDGGGE
jgi:hypothetical protein